MPNSEEAGQKSPRTAASAVVPSAPLLLDATSAVPLVARAHHSPASVSLVIALKRFTT
jgi:hypothetical protein